MQLVTVPLVPPIKGLKENIEAGNVATIFDMINNLNAGKYPDEACQGKKCCCSRQVDLSDLT